jgi:hypothetical protein
MATRALPGFLFYLFFLFFLLFAFFLNHNKKYAMKKSLQRVYVNKKPGSARQR